LRRESNSTITFFSTPSSADPVLTTRRIKSSKRSSRIWLGLFSGSASARLRSSATGGHLAGIVGVQSEGLAIEREPFIGEVRRDGIEALAFVHSGVANLAQAIDVGCRGLAGHQTKGLAAAEPGTQVEFARFRRNVLRARYCQVVIHILPFGKPTQVGVSFSLLLPTPFWLTPLQKPGGPERSFPRKSVIPRH
jgi:hypothetical protein